MFISQINMSLVWKQLIAICSTSALMFSRGEMHLGGSVEICVCIQTLSELQITSTSLSVLHRGLKVWVLFPHKWRIMAAKERQLRNKQSINFKTKPSTWVLNLKGSGHKRKKRCKERSQTIIWVRMFLCCEMYPQGLIQSHQAELHWKEDYQIIRAQGGPFIFWPCLWGASQLNVRGISSLFSSSSWLLSLFGNKFLLYLNAPHPNTKILDYEEQTMT